MATRKHLEVLKQGVQQWNKWREENDPGMPDLIDADLSEANLSDANFSETYLSGVNFTQANLRGVNMRGAILHKAILNRAILDGTNLGGADLRGAFLRRADLSYTNLVKADLRKANLMEVHLGNSDLSGADLRGARLGGADLHNTDLSWADLRGTSLENANLRNVNLKNAKLTDANLSCTNLVETDLTDATITGSRIYGVSAWNVTLEKTAQDNLVISKQGEPVITVDNLEVAQFVYLMLNNTKIRDVINSITSKGVLILGRFADPERKAVLDGLRVRLREFDLLPIVFDFDRPTDKDYTETVQTLAGMSMFVIVDVTNPKSTPLELEATVKQYKIPYVPIIDKSVDPRPFAMLVDLQKSFHWVLPTLRYQSREQLLGSDYLKKHIVDRAKAKREELWKVKNQEPEFYEPE